MVHDSTNTLTNRGVKPRIRHDTADGQALDASIDAARAAVLSMQHADGHWCHELEADCTIPAEYVLMLHYFGERERDVEAHIGNYLRRRQQDDGGWPLYESGATDISCSVKAYFALKMLGDDPDAAHMRRAREAILARGGAARANVFTRIALALYGEVPWRGVPVVPVELALLPWWAPVSLLSVSYWSRTVVLPLAVLCSLKPRAANPLDVHVRELFTTPPEKEKHYFGTPKSRTARLFLRLDAIGYYAYKLIPRFLHRPAVWCAKRWLLPRLNGVDGLGAIFPAMVNACEALHLMGYDMHASPLREARESLRRLLVRHGDEVYCQPSISPVWDTGLSCLAMQEDALGRPRPELDAAIDSAVTWLVDRQILNVRGDWAYTHRHLASGGWAFQYNNACYPDLDDTAVIAWAIHRSPRRKTHAECIRSAADWLVGMASRNGGYAAFDANNTRYWLNEIPFADHGALLDPPTSDVTARILTLLGQLDRPSDRQARDHALAFLRDEQEADGSWFGRWGTNYIYGTWSVLTALAAVGVGSDDPAVARGVAWLKDHQRDDGSWGETNDTYFDPSLAGTDFRGNAVQTAWALLGLLAAGEAGSEAVKRGIIWLIRQQGEDGHWHDAGFNAAGFPRVFYLKYHGYGYCFPYWALAWYRRERLGDHAG